MKVRHDEGIANRIAPEPCAGAREGTGEASAGVCAGQPLSRERPLSRAPTSFCWRKATRSGACKRERPDDLAWSETLACADAPCLWEPGELAFNRSA